MANAVNLKSEQSSLVLRDIYSYNKQTPIRKFSCHLVNIRRRYLRQIQSIEETSPEK